MSFLLFLFKLCFLPCSLFFFFNDTATTEIYTLSLHDALPISQVGLQHRSLLGRTAWDRFWQNVTGLSSLFEIAFDRRSEEHTSELQSHSDLVCRLLLEKKKEDDGWQRGRDGITQSNTGCKRAA